MTRRTIPTHLTDAQLKLVRSQLPKPKPGGRPQSVDRCESHARLDLVRGGIQWRMLPPDASPMGATVHYYYRQWRRDGSGR